MYKQPAKNQIRERERGTPSEIIYQVNNDDGYGDLKLTTER